MNSISNQLDMAKGNIQLNQAKSKLEQINRFKDVLKAEQKNASTKSSTGKEPVNQKLMDVCYEFESILVNQMFKVMRNTIHKENSLLKGGPAEQIFEDMLYDQYSLKVVKESNFGLAKQIYDQLS